MCADGPRQGGGGLAHRDTSELVAAQAPLHEEEIEADADQDDQEHHGGDGGAHVRVTHLQLESEEGAIEERAQDIGRIVRSGRW